MIVVGERECILKASFLRLQGQQTACARENERKAVSRLRLSEVSIKARCSIVPFGSVPYETLDPPSWCKALIAYPFFLFFFVAILSHGLPAPRGSDVGMGDLWVGAPWLCSKKLSAGLRGCSCGAHALSWWGSALGSVMRVTHT